MIDKNERLINKYTIKDLKERQSLTITIPLTPREASNLKYLKKNTKIRLKNKNGEIKDDIAYMRNVLNAINQLAQTGHNLTVIVDANNRELLRKSNLINNHPKNITLMLHDDEYEYPLGEYLKDERKLEELFAKIRNSSLSPFEKYVAVYNIVKNFKQYKYDENEKDAQMSRTLRYILRDDNDLIVCCGFARLLKDGLERVGIPCQYITVDVEDNDEGKYVGHARNLVKIDDDKYGIHGVYLADSTWDNMEEMDLYLNCILTFDRKKEAARLETLEDQDLLFDFHNYDDFNKKLQYYFKKHTSLPKITAAGQEELRKRCYKDLYIKIINYLAVLDYKKYQELYNKYNDYLNIDVRQTTSNKMETSMANFLYDYSQYIIPLSNKEIGMDKILAATAEVQKQIYYLSDQEIKERLTKAQKDNEERAKRKFPYIYNPNNPKEAFLEERKGTPKK